MNNNTANGGGHQIYTAITNSAGTEITEKKLMKTGQRVLLAYKKGEGDKGRKTRLKLQTRATNIVNTQSRGTWSPDERLKVRKTGANLNLLDAPVFQC